MEASSIHYHMEITHNIVLTHTRGVDFGRGVTDTYVVSFLLVLKLVTFLVEGFMERSNNLGIII